MSAKCRLITICQRAAKAIPLMKLLRRIAPTAMELVLLGRLFGECRNLFFGLSLFLRKGHPFANDFSARLVVFHVRDSLGYLILVLEREL